MWGDVYGFFIISRFFFRDVVGTYELGICPSVTKQQMLWKFCPISLVLDFQKQTLKLPDKLKPQQKKTDLQQDGAPKIAWTVGL